MTINLKRLSAVAAGVVLTATVGVATPSLAYKDVLEQSWHELSLKVGDGANREGGISWGCFTPPLLHRRSDMPCPTITFSS